MKIRQMIERHAKATDRIEQTQTGFVLAGTLIENAPALADLVETVQMLMRYPALKFYVGSEFFNPVEAALSKLSEEFQND